MRTREGIVISIVAAALVALAVVALAGCGLGGDDTATLEEYQETVVKIRNRVDFSLAEMAKSESVDELTERLDEAAAAVSSAAEDLDGSAVAEELEAEHDRLVDALNGLSGELSGTAATLSDPNFEDTLPLLRSLSFPQWDKANAALTTMKSKGIEVELLSRY